MEQTSLCVGKARAEPEFQEKIVKKKNFPNAAKFLFYNSKENFRARNIRKLRHFTE